VKLPRRTTSPAAAEPSLHRQCGTDARRAPAFGGDGVPASSSLVLFMPSKSAQVAARGGGGGDGDGDGDGDGGDGGSRTGAGTGGAGCPPDESRSRARTAGATAQALARLPLLSSNPYDFLPDRIPEAPYPGPAPTDDEGWRQYPLPGHAKFPLEKLHPHARDNHIIFWEEEHIYWLWNAELRKWEQSQGSISSLAAPHFEEFDQESAVDRMLASKDFPFRHERHAKYRKSDGTGMSRAEILASWEDNGTIQSNKGTKMHFDAECALNGIVYDYRSPEMALFRRWYAEWFRPRGLVPLRTEWEIFHRKLGLAGTIDFVGYYLNEEGECHVRSQLRAAGLEGICKVRKDGKQSIVSSKRRDVCAALQGILPGLDVARYGCVVIIDWKRSKHVYEEVTEMEEE